MNTGHAGRSAALAQTYIYLVTYKEPGRPAHGKVLAGFTVKYEANQWAELAPHPLEKMQLTRMRDGLTYHKAQEDIPWDVTKTMCPAM